MTFGKPAKPAVTDETFLPVASLPPPFPLDPHRLCRFCRHPDDEPATGCVCCQQGHAPDADGAFTDGTHIGDLP